MTLTTEPDECLSAPLVSSGNQPVNAGPGELYVVSIRKFVLLYVFTCSGYVFYWSYRNWLSCKDMTGADIMPVLRGVFWPFFILSQFEYVQLRLDMAGRSHCWHPDTRGLLLMLLVWIGVLLSMLFTRPSDTSFVFAVYMLLIAGGLFLWIGAQRAINVLQGDPKGSCNDTVSGCNVLWMMAGGLALLLAVCEVCS